MATDSTFITDNCGERANVARFDCCHWLYCRFIIIGEFDATTAG